MTSVQAEFSSMRLCAEQYSLSYALDAHQRGWSIIPLIGGDHPVYGKRPRIEWKHYQQQKCTEQHIHNWFSGGCPAYGVVCGSVSNLIVIDFDDAEIQSEFVSKYPHLLNTRIIQSGLRGTLHIYLQVNFPVSTCKLRGGDLKADGSYVVGAGSEIAGGIWQVVNDAPLYQISESELNEFLLEFGVQQKVYEGLSNLATDAKSPDDFVRIYEFLVHEFDSRNEALFRTGCYMRDEGYSLSDVITILAPVHAHQNATHQHKSERYKQRYREAECTIQSVFTKPPRPKRQQPSHQTDASYLPNALRETILIEGDGAAFLRVYEGLLLKGKAAGDIVTEREILELLSSHGVGRPSVRKALKFAISPSLRNPPHAVADLALTASTTKTCVFVPTTKGNKTIGRPANRFIMPDISYLCQLLNIDNRGADPITLEDIQSVTMYRAALNRELIKRRPGRYLQKWLGDRLNMCERTIQRYLLRENIKSRQLFDELRITWSNLNQIPTQHHAKRAGFNLQPYFLQDDQGKRYPPKPEIAKILLKQKHGVWLMKRSVKVYWCGRERVAKMQPEAHSGSNSQDILVQKNPIPDVAIASTQMMQVQLDVTETQFMPISQQRTKNVVAKQVKRSARFYKKPLADKSDEWLAQKIYLAAGNLQEVEARQLVDKYGRKAVGQALGRMEYLHERDKLRNPAGFIKIAAHVAWRTTHGFNVAQPQYQSPRRRRPHKRAYNPNQDPIWQSEAYRQWRLGFEDAPIDVWELPQTKREIEF